MAGGFVRVRYNGTMAARDDVRLLIPDLAPAPNQIFADNQIEQFLTLSDQKVFLAAARALEVVAADQALVYKIVRTDDLSINGVTGAVQVLLERAKGLRDDQVKADIESAPDEGFVLVFPDQSPRRPEATPFPCW